MEELDLTALFDFCQGTITSKHFLQEVCNSNKCGSVPLGKVQSADVTEGSPGDTG